jgi:DNA-directed RNA polymerase specialized sigma24 family protein
MTKEDRVQLLLTLRTLEEHHRWKRRCLLRKAKRVSPHAPEKLGAILADVARSQESIDWCKERFARFLPKGPRTTAELFEVVRQREDQGWTYEQIGEHQGLATASARALYQKARRALYVD